MAPGVRSLRKLQLGAEATAGTIVPATTIWRGTGSIEDQRKTDEVKEDVGYLMGFDRTNVPELKAHLQMPAIPATFEQLCYLLEASIKKVGTGAADGSASSGYKYIYPLPTNALNTLQTYTIEGGDNQAAEVMEYGYVLDWKLSSKGGAALTMEANWEGRQVAVQAFTGALTVPTVEDILSTKGKVWMDAIGGTIGTTQQTNTVLAVDVMYKSGIIPVFTHDGQLYFSFSKVVEPSLDVTIIFEHDSFGAAKKVDWRAQTARLFRLQWGGNAYATPGSATLMGGKGLRIDGSAKIMKVTKLDEQNGNDILTATLKFKNNLTAAIAPATITVTNELTALT